MDRRLLIQRFFATLAGLSGLNGHANTAPPTFNAVSADNAAITPKEFPEWLRKWRALPRLPITDSEGDAVVARLLAAAASGRSVHLRYDGGSTPGEARRFTPDLIFRTDLARGPLYVSGWCHTRKAHRILRIDRIRRESCGAHDRLGSTGSVELN